MFSSQNSQVSSDANYIEDVFQTFLYTGNASTQTITNGIDLAGKGGLVWIKNRTTAGRPHIWEDTVRGLPYYLSSDSTNAQGSLPTGITSFNANGFSIDAAASINGSGDNIASWTFRKQPKFFDVVTYTGTGANRTIAHALGSTPGCVIVKRTDTTGNWQVYHNSLTSAAYSIQLNLTNAQASATTVWNSTAPTSTVFSVGTDATVNASGGTYVAYLFAHDAGGFGLTGTDNVISCGSYTDNGTDQFINLGYEPQWILVKDYASSASWRVIDNMRGWNGQPVTATASVLTPNTSAAEVANGAWLAITQTGFQIKSGSSLGNSSFIYIAIRRGPMKVPTSGTSVFSPIAYVGANGAAQNISAGFPVDMDIIKIRNDGTRNPLNHARLMGGVFLSTNTTGAQQSYSDNIVSFNNAQDVIGLPVTGGGTNEINGASTSTYIGWAMRRAPSFMDVVCYTGTGADLTLSHNLQAVPEMIICKAISTTGSWPVYHKDSYNGFYGGIDLDSPLNGTSNYSTLGAWKATPTSSVFFLPSPTYSTVNVSGQTYVAYLFSTCAGVSKVGGYTGTGTTKQIDCGFTSGARFVLIRRTDADGSWYVWDSARGIVSGNDPYLLLNSTAAEVTNTDYVDTYSAGFEISSTAPSAINASGGTFIFLAIA